MSLLQCQKLESYPSGDAARPGLFETERSEREGDRDGEPVGDRVRERPPLLRAIFQGSHTNAQLT